MQLGAVCYALAVGARVRWRQGLRYVWAERLEGTVRALLEGTVPALALLGHTELQEGVSHRGAALRCRRSA